MINILLEGYDIGAKWLHSELKNYIMLSQRVAVVALSFRDSQIRNLSDWNALYGESQGRLYRNIIRGFEAYGIMPDQISFVNYFTDTPESAKAKVTHADIIYFPGGLPDRMMERIEEMNLRESLACHQGIMMGYSAGALVQFSEYHLSPDHDYPSFGYFEGLSCIDGFYLEVHYEGTEIQKEAIRKVIMEKEKNVYASSLMKGAILIDNGKIRTIGDVHVFRNISEI